ncbi:hypothetical protein A0H81_13795 [Grifola frondosa]|uniref:PARP catalytic domain-containing protein n=1 Tax=Grifola frondosa TaxID=5627 RepID=A0A1C7LN73_GRIFR|nr:hypothetical protein A0H81_13795 [Grifola frondosa]
MDEFSAENPVNETSSRYARLIPLPKTDPNYEKVSSLFRKGWKHPAKQPPQLCAIFKIVSPGSALQPFLDYKSIVSKASSWNAPSELDSEVLLFHGTNRACLLGENLRNVVLCNLSECYLCTIIRESYAIEKCGSKHGFTRFGTGIYTSACSSKADDYVCNKSQDAIMRVLLVNRVVVGRPKRMLRNAVHLKAPPYGFHSVIGVPGADLNYEETVVYSNDAIRPSYLVAYDSSVSALEERRRRRVALLRLFTTPLAS